MRNGELLCWVFAAGSILCACSSIDHMETETRIVEERAQVGTVECNLDSVPRGAHIHCENEYVASTPATVKIGVHRDRVSRSVYRKRKWLKSPMKTVLAVHGVVLGTVFTTVGIVLKSDDPPIASVIGVSGGLAIIASLIPVILVRVGETRSRVSIREELTDWKFDEHLCTFSKDGYVSMTVPFAYPNTSYYYQLLSSDEYHQKQMLAQRQYELEQMRRDSDRKEREAAERKRILELIQRQREERARAQEEASTVRMPRNEPVTVTLRGQEVTFYTDTSVGCVACTSACVEVGNQGCGEWVRRLCSGVSSPLLSAGCYGAVSGTCQSSVQENCKSVCCD